MNARAYVVAMFVMAGFVSPQLALADCADVGDTGSGGDIIVCTGADPDGYDGTANGDDVTVQPGASVIDPVGDDAIFTADGADTVTVNGGTVTAVFNDGIAGGNGADTITVNAGTLDAEEDAIDGDDDDDVITINGGTVHGDDSCADGGGGFDTITVNGGNLTAGGFCIDNDEGDGQITITGGTLLSGDEVVKGHDGQNVVTITGGTLTSSDEDVIDTDAGDDIVSIKNATLTTQDEPDHVAVQLDTGDDQLTLGNGAVIQGNQNGLIDGGDHNKGDTLTFDMTVPAGDLAALQAAIAGANPAGDSITINGETYTWINFEELVDSLSGQVESETTRATFEVNKDFTDDNPAGVEVTISCNTGLPLEQSKVITEGAGVEFVVTEFDDGELDCEITEDVPSGYDAVYFDGTSNSSTSCEYLNVEAGAAFACRITNSPAPVDVVIHKEWVFEGSSQPQGIDQRYDLTLWCDAEIVGGFNFGELQEAPSGNGPPCGLIVLTGQDSPQGFADWCKVFFGDGSDTFTAEVIPEFPDSHCFVIERLFDDAVEVDNGCQNITVSAGVGASCTITNTVFFEGIPTLNQYGLALLALLMLGVGFVGFRRFA
jgi:hypothetical protein